MAINLGRPQKNQPTKIWIGINIEFILPTKTLFQKIFNLSNYPKEIDFDISVIAIDKNKKMTNDNCFVYYDQPSSIGINIDTFHESPVAREFDEIISVDFLKISSEISSLKFTISNHKDELFENCELSFFVYDQPIWTLPSGKELFDFKIKPTVQFNLIELFEIHLSKKHFEWELEVLQNPLVLSEQSNFSEYIKIHT
jgi:stress response protein SCP2